MKTYLKILVILVSIFFTSCEDVIDVEVSEGKTRLVIEASIDWEKGTAGNNQRILLSRSTPYFQENKNDPATGASVKVTNNDTGEEFVFEDQNNGSYITSTFVPILNNEYTLEILYNGETYTGNETLIPVPDINRITQSVEGGFDKDFLEVNVYFDDPEEEGDHYQLSFIEEGEEFTFSDIENVSDEFVNGNEIYEFYEKTDDEDNNEEPFEVGDVVNINLRGISERYYNFSRLLQELYDAGGDPFSSTPAEIRGNCINKTNSENYPNGYFRVVEYVQAKYTFE